MANDDSAVVEWKDVKCKYCKTVLCRSDDYSIRFVHYVETVSGGIFAAEYERHDLSRMDIECDNCGLTKIWRRRQDDTRTEERDDRRQH